MVSDLYWRTGFGWTSVVILILSVVGTVILGKNGQGISGIIAIVTLIYMFYRYNHWNGTPWKQVHGRGMLLYSVFSGIESNQAQKENRPFSIAIACYMMAEKMCGPEKSANVSAMIDGLLEEQGNYLKELILSFPTNDFHILAERAGEIKFCPQLVIANIILNSYGQEEAAKYAIALLRGKVR